MNDASKIIIVGPVPKAGDEKLLAFPRAFARKVATISAMEKEIAENGKLPAVRVSKARRRLGRFRAKH